MRRCSWSCPDVSPRPSGEGTDYRLPGGLRPRSGGSGWSGGRLESVSSSRSVEVGSSLVSSGCRSAGYQSFVVLCGHPNSATVVIVHVS